MYTLRTVAPSSKQSNQSVGDFYSVIERDFNYPEFAVNYKEFFGKEHSSEMSDDEGYNVYAFVQHFGTTIPLYENSSYYIMTESGKTFSNLSRR